MEVLSRLDRVRTYWEYCNNSPIKEKTIFYSAFRTKIMADSPFALFREILTRPEYADYKHIWVYGKEEVLNNDTFKRYAGHPNVQYVLSNSEEYLDALATSQYLITNAALPDFWMKRDGQIVVNTWHGTPLKTLGKDARDFSEASVANAQRNFLLSDYLVMPNRYTADKLLDSYMVRGITQAEVLDVGSPRSDLIRNADRSHVINLLEEISGKSLTGKKIVLYAPTFRSKNGKSLDTTAEMAAIVSRLAKNLPEGYELFFKAHNTLGKLFMKMESLRGRVVFDEIETNELLSAVDVLVTDYSSIFIDYLLLRRPIILFAYDKENYVREHGLYLDIETMPGLVCETLEEVIRDIQAFDEGRSKIPRLEESLQRFYPYEGGEASRRVVDVILGRQASEMVDAKGTLGFDGRKRVLVSLESKFKLSSVEALFILLEKLDPSTHNVTIIASQVEPIWEECLRINPEVSILFSNVSISEGMHSAVRDDVFYHNQFEKYFSKMHFDCYYNLKKSEGFLDEVLTAVFPNLEKHWVFSWTRRLTPVKLLKKVDQYDTVTMYCRSRKTVQPELKDSSIQVIDRAELLESLAHRMTVLVVGAVIEDNAPLAEYVSELTRRGHHVIAISSENKNSIANDALTGCGFTPFGADVVDAPSFDFVDLVLGTPSNQAAYSNLYSNIRGRNALLCALAESYNPVKASLHPDFLLAVDEADSEGCTEVADLSPRIGRVLADAGMEGFPGYPNADETVDFLEACYKSLVKKNKRVSSTASCMMHEFSCGTASLSLVPVNIEFNVKMRYYDAIDRRLSRYANENALMEGVSDTSRLSVFYDVDMAGVSRKNASRFIESKLLEIDLCAMEIKSDFFLGEGGRAVTKQTMGMQALYAAWLYDAGALSLAEELSPGESGLFYYLALRSLEERQYDNAYDNLLAFLSCEDAVRLVGEIECWRVEEGPFLAKDDGSRTVLYETIFNNVGRERISLEEASHSRLSLVSAWRDALECPKEDELPEDSKSVESGDDIDKANTKQEAEETAPKALFLQLAGKALSSSIISKAVGDSNEYDEIETSVEAEFGKSRYKLRIAKYARLIETTRVSTDVILYESNSGRGMVDNPYAIFSYLIQSPKYSRFKHVWVINDFESCKSSIDRYADHENVFFIHANSSEYVRFLATAKYLINNVTFPPYFVKRPGQIYVNTWHGTPIKLMGYDMPGGNYAMANMIRNCLAADYLLAANSVMTSMYLKSFRLKGIMPGVIVEEGYPRIDSLFSVNREEVFEKLRACDIEVDSSKSIILYAPTWRQGVNANTAVNPDELLDVKARLEDGIDTEKYQVLIKPHQFVYERLKGDIRCRGKLVPHTIDADEILSVTEILISDFSSIYFDFLATNRPILFYVPDIDEYKKDRGLDSSLLNLPGPTCLTVKDLARCIQNIEQVENEYAECYRAMRERICSKDDGVVTKRIVSLIFDGQSSGLKLIRDEHEKKRILISNGEMLENGITRSLLSLLDTIDYGEWDVTVYVSASSKDQEMVRKINEDINSHVRVIVRLGPATMTPKEEIARRFYAKYGVGKLNWNKYYPTGMMRREFMRSFGSAQFDYIVDFNGFSQFYAPIMLEGGKAKKTIWLHSDMLAEMHREVHGEKRLFENLRFTTSLYPRFDNVVSCGETVMEVNRANFATRETDKRFKFAKNTLSKLRIERSFEEKELIQVGGREYYVQVNSDLQIGPTSISFIKLPDERHTNYVTLGRLSTEKNQAALVEAFARVHERNANSRLYLVGDGPLREDLEHLINQLNISDFVTITGNVVNPYIFLRRCDCFLLPSLHEGQPMSLLEARTCGLPIIVSEFSTIKDSLYPEGQLVIKPTVEGIYEGMIAFEEGKVPTCDFNLDEYNKEAYRQFVEAIS